MEQTLNDTITAVATPHGTGGIAVIRLSGPDAFAIADSVWKGSPLSEARSHTAHFGRLMAEDGSTLDECMATVMRGPHSFTGEDTVEFSVHGSEWIQRQTVRRLIAAGARPAGPGEFTRRAFVNGKMDLAQAEAVADIISASSRAAHSLAMSQLSGRFSSRLNELRSQLVDLASLLELELDFSEEDVTFADRSRLLQITDEALALTGRLIGSYRAGRAFKEGVPVVIAGAPNAGKSTLLNALLDEDRAIVSDIPGTTRDIIEDVCEIGGILFRFHDTAGLRDTADQVENIGIGKALELMRRAAIILWLVDPTADTHGQIAETKRRIAELPDAHHIILLTKADVAPAPCADIEEDTTCHDIYSQKVPGGGGTDGQQVQLCSAEGMDSLSISARTGEGMEALKRHLTEAARQGHDPDSEIILTNERHLTQLQKGREALLRVREGLESTLPADLIAQDVREALYHLGTVTGSITTPDLLTTIFSRFCIGK